MEWDEGQKILILWWFTENSDFEEVHKKTMYWGGGLSKKGGLVQFANLRGDLAKKRGGGVFDGYLILQCTLRINI